MQGILVLTASYPMIVGAVISERRRRNDCSQSDLSIRLGIEQSSLSKLERGVSAVTVEQLAILAAELNTTPGSILAQSDRVAAHMESCGIRVESKRISGKDAITSGSILMGSGNIASMISEVKHLRNTEVV